MLSSRHTRLFQQKQQPQKFDLCFPLMEINFLFERKYIQNKMAAVNRRYVLPQNLKIPTLWMVENNIGEDKLTQINCMFWIKVLQSKCRSQRAKFCRPKAKIRSENRSDRSARSAFTIFCPLIKYCDIYFYLR